MGLWEIGKVVTKLILTCHKEKRLHYIAAAPTLSHIHWILEGGWGGGGFVMFKCVRYVKKYASTHRGVKFCQISVHMLNRLPHKLNTMYVLGNVY